MDLDKKNNLLKDFAAVRSAFRRNLIGSEELNDKNNPHIAFALNKIESSALSVWETMNHGSDMPAFFGTKPVKDTDDMTKQYQALRVLTKGYGTYGTSIYKNTKLRDDILFGLKWLNENLYGDAEIANTGWRDTQGFNWWDWYLGTPTSLLEILLIMDSEVCRADVEKYIAPYDHFRATMMLGNEKQGDSSHAYARIYTGAMRTVLLEDTELWDRIYKDCEIAMVIREKGEGNGVQKDFMYIHHNHFPMTGMYGVGILISRLIKTLTALSGTQFELLSPNKYHLALYLYHTFDPLMFGGEITPRVCGRNPKEDPTCEIITGAINLLGCFKSEDDTRIKNIIKRYVDKNNLNSLIEGMSIYHAAKLIEIFYDQSIFGKEQDLAHVYYTGDMIVQHRKSYGAALAMSSSRIGNYECINGKNTRGWYQGDGVLYIYRPGNKADYQYGAAFWDHVNPYRLPGITEDSQIRKDWSIRHAYIPTKDFVGGVELDGKYAVGAMDFEAYRHYEREMGTDADAGGQLPYLDNDLTARKSWFMLDNEIIALGCGITSTKNSPVYTVVENKIIKGGEKIIVDGKFMESKKGNKQSFSNPSWVHMEDSGGYYFPHGGKLSINLTDGEVKFAEFWLNHGENPQNADYAYVILPNASAEQTGYYAVNPDVEMLSNTSQIQAVYDKKTGITGIVFWEAGSFGGITVSAPLAVITHEANGEYIISASDPSQLTPSAVVSIDKQLVLKERDPNVVIKEGEKTEITLSLGNNPGKSLTAYLKILNKYIN
ncbi:MAG: polysaccharide lyase 8 family protein [Firmicutes bacterium]|nr:polysaccharide lyase 8 family protein [Bacillota bacterium]